MKKNRGSGGVDRVSIEDFEQNLHQNLDEIHRLLKEDRYFPQPVRRVWIPKSNGDKRALGIPAVRDRVVQQALLDRLQRIFDPLSCECSCGFRSGKNPHQAIPKILTF